MRHASGAFSLLTVREGLPHDVVLALAATDDGSLWVGTNGGGLARFHDGRFSTLTRKDGLATDAPGALRVDGEGALWIGHERAVDRWRDGRLERVLPVGRLVPSALRDGLMLLTASGLAMWDGGRLTPVDGIVQGTTTILDDRDGNRWLSVQDKGLCRAHDGLLECSGFEWVGSTDTGAPPVAVEVLLEDRDGNLWAGGSRGLMRLSDPRVVPFGPPEGYPSDGVRTVAEDGAGRILAGGGEGLVVPAGAGWRLLTARDGLPATHVTSLLVARDGTVWVGTEAGLCLLRDDRITRPRHRLLRVEAPVLDLEQDSAGTVWVSFRDVGLVHAAGSEVRLLTKDDGLTDNRLGAVLAASDGSLWVGGTGGLNRLRDGRWQHWTTAERLAANYVLTLHEDREGTLWIGSWGGLSRLRDGQVTAWTPRHGLPTDIVFQVLEDGDGNLWLGTPAGVFAVAKAELEAVARGERESVEGRLLAQVDGTRGGCMGSTQPAGVRARDGRLYFAGLRALLQVDPRRALQTESAPRVVLREVLVDGQPQPAGLDVRVPPGRRALEVTFTSPVFVSPERLRFRCRLAGFDEDWQDLGDRRAAIYTNLPPGRLRFEVAAQHAASGWGGTVAFGVAVEPRLVETWPFRGFLVLAAGLLVAGGFRARLRYLERRERELEAQVAERTVELAAANRELERLASEDGLTKVANKRMFETFYADEWRRAVRNAAPLSVIMLDVDFFKRYNDRHGHLRGDECLRAVAGVLRERVRRAGDLVARYGGEEFVVVLASARLEGAVQVAEELRAGVEALRLPHGASDVAPHVTISLGVASTVPGIGADPASLVAAADAALYRAKAAGRNRVERQ
ncbi:MAG: diguanylate cyclase [Thermoanaerobaculaceae bacterium]